jgi:hypothetical protein
MFCTHAWFVRKIFKYLQAGVEVSGKQNKLKLETFLSKTSDIIVRTVQRVATDFMEFIFWEQSIFRFVSLLSNSNTIYL